MANLNTETTLSLLPPSPHLPVVHHLVTIKLNRENYLLWKAQIVPYLRGQHLFGFLDGSRPAPPQILTVTTAEISMPQPNPDYHTWLVQDQMILSGCNRHDRNRGYTKIVIFEGEVGRKQDP